MGTKTFQFASVYIDILFIRLLKSEMTKRQNR